MRWKELIAAFVAGGLVATAIVVAVHLSNGSADERRLTFSSTEVPGEYLYLDRERVLSYLAQIQGGAVGETTTSSVREQSGKVLVDTGTALGGEGGLKVVESATRVVTPTDASNFLLLLEKLADRQLQRPVRLREIDADTSPADFSKRLMELHEGDFVALRNARVLMPVYAQPFDAIKRFGSLEIGGTPADLRLVQRVAPQARQQAIRYAKRIGANPRIVLNLGARDSQDGPLFGRHIEVVRHPDKTKDVEGCPARTDQWRSVYHQKWPVPDDVNPLNARVLLPVQYALLTAEGSLLSGGSSTVLGKVVRVLHPPVGPGRPRVTDVCYQDLSVLNTFQLREGRLPVEALPGLRDIAGNRIDPKRLTLSVKSDTGAIAPAAVVIPVAIIRDGGPPCSPNALDQPATCP